jgi:Fe-S cluster biogenesis protein NfuA/nitrite reductase/ring-hydroxylating ferredoxin subunit
MEFDRAVAELATLVETLEREGDERALHLLALVDALHRPALQRIADGELGHPIVQALLAMYGGDDELAAEEALDEVRGYIESHGGSLELLAVEDGIVHVRLGGSCVGCAASAMTLRRGVEQALREHMPGFRDLVAEEATPEAAPLLQIEVAPTLRRPVFVDVAGPLAEGELRSVAADGVDVLLARAGGDVYALRDGCAVDGRSLAGGRLTADGVLVCPWHNCPYDIRSGRRVDGEDGRLPVVPVAVDGDAVKIAVNVA